MKKLSEVIPSHSTISTPETKRPLDCDRAQKVWVQMAELFGKAFYRENGNSPSNLWVQAISRLQDYEIVRGLVNLANDNIQFPANLSQFVSACKRTAPVRQLGVKYLEDNREPGTMSFSDWKQKRNA